MTNDPLVGGGGSEYWLSPSAAVAALIPATFVEWEDEDTHCPS